MHEEDSVKKILAVATILGVFGGVLFGITCPVSLIWALCIAIFIILSTIIGAIIAWKITICNMTSWQGELSLPTNNTDTPTTPSS